LPVQSRKIGPIGLYEAPAPDLSPNKSVGFEHFVRARDRRPAQANRPGQFARRRQLLALRHAPGSDRRPYLLENLLIERGPGRRVDVKFRDHYRPSIPYWPAW